MIDTFRMHRSVDCGSGKLARFELLINVDDRWTSKGTEPKLPPHPTAFDLEVHTAIGELRPVEVVAALRSCSLYHSGVPNDEPSE